MNKGFAHILIVFIFLILAIAGLFFFKHIQKKETGQMSNISSEKDAWQISNGYCKGDEKRKLTHLPMKLEDFSMIIPYGLVVGDHVTPIDHQYFSPTVFHSARDAYEVYAMADATLVSLQPRVKPEYTEYRLVFSISCKLFYYYDLVTVLTPELQAKVDKFSPVEVKAGQLIGKIGGQTLDFAVWDMDTKLSGFVVPEHYQGEAWKIYTVDPLDYYTDELKAQALSKYVRTVPPISGKIDYDVDGKLVGNWFLQGSNGYRDFKDGPKTDYPRSHLAIAPHHIDPSVYMVSFGDFAEEFKQFAIKTDLLDPTKVGVDSGLVKYNLFDFYMVKDDGQMWDWQSFAKNLTLKTRETANCVLFQLTSTRVLKAESFPGKSCSDISGFSPAAKIYER